MLEPKPGRRVLLVGGWDSTRQYKLGTITDSSSAMTGEGWTHGKTDDGLVFVVPDRHLDKTFVILEPYAMTCGSRFHAQCSFNGHTILGEKEDRYKICGCHCHKGREFSPVCEISGCSRFGDRLCAEHAEEEAVKAGAKSIEEEEDKVFLNLAKAASHVLTSCVWPSCHSLRLRNSSYCAKHDKRQTVRTYQSIGAAVAAARAELATQARLNDLGRFDDLGDWCPHMPVRGRACLTCRNQWIERTRK